MCSSDLFPSHDRLPLGTSAEVKFRKGVGSPKIVNSGTGTPIGAGNLSVIAGGYLEGAGASGQFIGIDPNTSLYADHIQNNPVPFLESRSGWLPDSVVVHRHSLSQNADRLLQYDNVSDYLKGVANDPVQYCAVYADAEYFDKLSR